MQPGTSPSLVRPHSGSPTRSGARPCAADRENRGPACAGHSPATQPWPREPPWSGLGPGTPITASTAEHFVRRRERVQ